MQTTTARVLDEMQGIQHREEVLQKMETSDKPGAKVIAQIIRKADVKKADALAWAQNWSAHSRQT